MIRCVNVTGQMLLGYATSAFKSANVTVGSPDAAQKAGEFKSYLKGPMFQPSPPVPKGAPLLISPESASTAKIEADGLVEVNDALYTMLKDMCDAISQAWQNWQNSAQFAGILINGPVGQGMPGCLIGFGMDKDLILMPLSAKMNAASNVMEAKGAPQDNVKAPGTPGKGMPSSTRTSSDFDFLKKHCEAVVSALAFAWKTWQTGYMVTIPFPTGAVCSTTMPPSPNTPVPVMTGMSPGDIQMNEQMLKLQMLGNYTSPEMHPKITDAFFSCMSSAIAQAFIQWKAQTQITNVMGTGGVAPPPPAPPGPVAGAMGTGGKLV
jgi:hypothetical protein